MSQELFNESGTPIKESICVDASCRGNPGPMEYRVVNYKTGQEIYRSPVYRKGTNIIGEFLAIVHALAWLSNNKLDWPVYSDCAAAIIWAKHKRINTTLEANDDTRPALTMVTRALVWLNQNIYDPEKILKWDTENWGEIPADYGRK